MPERPDKFSVGDVLTEPTFRAKLNRLVDYCRSLEPHGDGQTVKVNRIPGGSFFSARAGRGGGGSAPGSAIIRITSGTGHEYLCSVYGNGYDRDSITNPAPTDTGVPAVCLQIAATETIPAGTVFMATKQLVRYSGSMQRVYTFEVPRDL